MSEKDPTPDEYLVQTAQKLIEEAAQILKNLLDKANEMLQKKASDQLAAEEKRQQQEEMLEMFSALLEKYGFKASQENLELTREQAEKVNELNQQIEAADNSLEAIDMEIGRLDTEIAQMEGLDKPDPNAIEGLKDQRTGLVNQRAGVVMGIGELEAEKEGILSGENLAKELDGPGEGLSVDAPKDLGVGGDLELKSPALDGGDAKAPALDEETSPKISQGASKGLAGKVLSKASPVLNVAKEGLGAVSNVAEKGGKLLNKLADKASPSKSGGDDTGGKKNDMLAELGGKGPISAKLVAGKDFGASSVAKALGTSCDWLETLKGKIDNLKQGIEEKVDSLSQGKGQKFGSKKG